MTRTEAMRLTRQQDTLLSLGFTVTEAESLRRISMTLRRWFERECGDGYGCVERDEDTGRTYTRSAMTGKRWPCRDMETGARRRLAAILVARNNRQNAIGATYQHAAGRLSAYVQTDPRGAALYILRPGDIPEGCEPMAYYSRGICVY